MNKKGVKKEKDRKNNSEQVNEDLFLSISRGGASHNIHGSNPLKDVTRSRK